MRRFSLPAAVAYLLACFLYGSLDRQTWAANSPSPVTAFTIYSPDTRLRAGVPDQYVAHAFGCTGGNTSPPLAWRNPPPGTQSFVLTLFDRDERSTPSGWWHWVLYDLPSATGQLSEGAGAEHSALLPAGSQQGRTDLGTAAYHGPCPAKGDPPHRYVFTIYALKVAKLPVPPEASGAMVTSMAQDLVIGKASFTVHFGR
jgi:Raf kinase inhibitor-like YbhB/YbcL family protein